MGATLVEWLLSSIGVLLIVGVVAMLFGVFRNLYQGKRWANIMFLAVVVVAVGGCTFERLQKEDAQQCLVVLNVGHAVDTYLDPKYDQLATCRDKLRRVMVEYCVGSRTCS